MIETTTLEPPVINMLTPPEPVAAVSSEKALSLVPVTIEQHQQLDIKVAEFIGIVVDAEVNSDSFKEKVNVIHNMGNADIREAASISNRMLDRSINTLNQTGGLGEKSVIIIAMTDLRITAEKLDPSQQDLLSQRKILGLIPFGNNLRDYFLQYQSAQSHIKRIIDALYNGRDELLKDNAAIEIEKANLWSAMSKLEQHIYLGKKIDLALEKKITEIEAQSPEKCRVVREEMQFYVRQKTQDLLTQLAVSVQGYLVLEYARKTNLDLIKGVDRATTTTVSALRIAIMAAQVLTNQKLVLDQINALTSTTGDIVAGTANRLKQQSIDIVRQSTDPAIQLEKLTTAFADIYQAIDIVSDYRIKSLPNMQKTIETLSIETDKAKTYLDATRRQKAVEIIGEAQPNNITVNL